MEKILNLVFKEGQFLKKRRFIENGRIESCNHYYGSFIKDNQGMNIIPRDVP
jgi:hypothetical protein